VLSSIIFIYFNGAIGYHLDMAKSKIASMRLTPEEYERLEKVVQRAKERSLGYATEADVLRELIGLRPLKAVTEEDRYFITHGKERARTRSNPA